jgi:hypothetical protein
MQIVRPTHPLVYPAGNGVIQKCSSALNKLGMNRDVVTFFWLLNDSAIFLNVELVEQFNKHMQ